MQIRFWAIVAGVLAVIAAIVGAVYLVRSPASTGTLVVEVHDAPCNDCSHVWVSFQSVAVHASNSSGGGWVTINVTGSSVDLMALNGTALAKVIGVASLTAGHYEQVRLAVTNVTVALSNGTRVAAVVPAASSGDFDGSFNVSSGSTTTISVDVDLASSLHVEATGTSVQAVFTPHIGSIEVV